MSKPFSNTFLTTILIACPGLIFWSLLLARLYPVHLSDQTLFFFDLIEFHQSLPQWSAYFLGAASFLLVYFVAKEFFVKSQVYIPLLIFSISPWSAYLVFAGSFYIYLLTLLMLSLYGVLLLKSGKNKFAMAIFLIGSTFALYSSLLMLIIFPLILFAIYLTKLLTLKLVKQIVILLVVLCLPLFIFIIKNPAGLKNIFESQVSIFSDPGLINNVNRFQGESKRSGFFYVSKMVENKYVYLTRYLVYKATKHLYFSTYFTSQEQLLNFSFTPPIFLGFLIPFLYGSFIIVKKKSLRKILVFLILLMIPSFLSKTLVDLNRLVLIFPFIIFISSYGIIILLKKGNKRIHKLMLLVCLILVLAQLFTTVFDIQLREYSRYERYFNGSFKGNFEIGK